MGAVAMSVAVAVPLALIAIGVLLIASPDVGEPVDETSAIGAPADGPTAARRDAAPSADPGASETDAGTARASVFDLQVGDCFSGADEDEVSDVGVVECEDEHAYEVFALGSYEGESNAYPGETAIDTFAEELCTGPEFESYVGVPYADSIYYATWLAPSPESWKRLHDREIVCVLYEPEDPSDPVDPVLVRGSARDTER